MKIITVNLPDRKYDICIGQGLLRDAGSMISGMGRIKKVALVTDSNVGPLYGEAVKTSLASVGLKVGIITVPAGEQSKSLAALEYLYDQFMEFGLSRQDCVVALGGGVVGDLAGMAAATILRGVDFIQIPTTLLAQTDSSVGGKVAVNLKAGKNLVGTFYQPDLVLVDPEVLETLSDKVFSDGMAEVIKYGAICDAELFAKLLSFEGRAELMDNIEKIIYRCCNIKRLVVQEDETDRGGRILLNFGHTLGHAYEQAYNYEKYSHGEAVAAGMCKITEIGERLGKTKAGSLEGLRHVVHRYGLPQAIEAAPRHIAAALGLDKKGDGENIKLVLLSSIGDAFIYPMSREQLLQEVAK